MAPSVVCAWCGRRVREGSPGAVSHGICASCAGESGQFPVESLGAATPAMLDRLPFGLIRVSREGTILAYNAAEETLSGRRRADVVGRNFFREIAPCTAVAAFEGEVAKLWGSDSGGRTTFAFVFEFPGGRVLVTIAAARDPGGDVATLLVQATP
ncbi:MAG: PAS domain-containing protein [Planctomycetia bacterium]|nr:PAS domain-containing protein [Planctomycetia bacterium]